MKCRKCGGGTLGPICAFCKGEPGATKSAAQAEADAEQRAKLLAHVDERKRFARPDGYARIAIRVDPRTEGGVSYLEIARINADGSTRSTQAFHREELRELRDAIESCRRVLLGADEQSDDARAQESVGLRPAKARRR